MAKEYRVPALLPAWLIAVMVLVLALPVLAYVFVLKANQDKIAALKLEREKVNKELAAKLAAIEKREEREWDRDRYELLVREFNLRFLKNEEEAKKLWLGTRPNEGVMAMLGLDTVSTQHRHVRDSKLPGFAQEYVQEFRKSGTHKQLIEIMEKLGTIKRTVYQAPVAWVKVRLPSDVNLPPLTEAASKPDTAPPGLYFEKDEVASKEQEATVGKVWWVGPGWTAFTDAVLKEKQAESPEPRWKEAIMRLRENVGRPCTKDISGSSEPTFDSETGVRRLPKEYPVFYYLEYFMIMPSSANVPDRHEINARIVFPLLEKTQ